jgi:SAM-dependent methyltransferase
VGERAAFRHNVDSGALAVTLGGPAGGARRLILYQARDDDRIAGRAGCGRSAATPRPPRSRMSHRYRIQFPPTDTDNLDQDEAFFYLADAEGDRQQIRFHDYDELYKRPGLYEQLFYERLKCQSPKKVAKILHETVDEAREHFSELRVLDLGAGNGMMGEALKRDGVARLVGVDILDEAYMAVERDRPWVYDAYYVTDFTKLPDDQRDEIAAWAPNCMVSVAALGYGDIPPRAFFEAMNVLQTESWVAFNIKETFLDRADQTGFSRLIRELIFSDYLDIHHLERYWHRYSIEGTPLYYFALVAKKNADIPESLLESLDLA